MKNSTTDQSTKATLSPGQINVLMTIVFRKGYRWFSSLSAGACFGRFDDEDNHFLDKFSPEQIRCLIWRNFEIEFGLADGMYKDLPRNRYQEAKSYLKSISWEVLQQNVPSVANIHGEKEDRPDPYKAERRYLMELNPRRIRDGYPPLMPRRNRAGGMIA